MRMTQIAKASLALGLLTTGASIVTTQSAKAEVTPSLKSEQLSMISVSPSAVTTTTQGVNAEVASALKTEQAIKSNIQKVTTSHSTNAQPQSTQSTPKPTTPPSANVETPQPQSPTTKQAQKEINPKYKDLRTYYTKPSLEFEKQFGFMLKPWTTVRFMNVIPDWFIYKIALVGKDDKKYKDGPYDNIDVFIVLEDNKYQLKKYSVGGITKTNSKKVDHKAELSITKKDEEGKISRDVSEYKITKEEISLKELDFKLRKQLIEQHNLYGNIGSGTIVIKTKNGGKYTFELHKKLQEHRMADVIDGTSIDRIEVNLTSS
ncbi:TPA: superantigen-like protein SSL4 [Staphylococcus aureus]|uniref:Exotoxin n=5 Tax=Staphylococcus aureus TaxID=1280 RepID=A0A2S6DRH3_STAAU|nr:superantigen-like protein SSL4 [Staphylococcus aureus]HDH6210788.1 superantigen-like protein SSL4 [Staphylococcus aureus LTCF-12-55]HDH6225343.1 superantigen-like protein SSL4 [Staphylococcus aureus LTCF-12-46]HDH6264443.1 superantigen-like protein SSL4 [Staphylococcus aureus LTCF-7-30]HDH6421699.1 superantigen-like protein SSL4 [Staphylococcus aureus MRSA-Lux-33]HDH6424018.1 superantigen-like protein SSL4 [Staphylococcus aureus MRSA-Lux-34]HDH6427001.1 superantigen-like protein SSL4 [Stap